MANSMTATTTSVPADRLRAEAATLLAAPVDIYETPESILVAMDIPGVAADALDITFEDGELSISGKAVLPPAEGYDPLYREFGGGTYQRRFALSEAIDADGIEARMVNGELQLRLPKSERAKMRRIALKSA